MAHREKYVKLALDCKYYKGDRPCSFGQTCPCDYYSPMGVRVLIIKLGALGDVVRTACLPATLRRLYPQCHITWVSLPNGVDILTGHPLIDQLVPMDAENILALQQQRFDLVLSLDKEPAPAALCNAVACPDKRGIMLSPFGTAQPANRQCQSYFELGLDDERKFRVNRKSYGELIHEALDLPYEPEPYRLYPDEKAIQKARTMFAPWRASRRGAMIGLNTGCGAVFANKAPAPARWVEIADQLHAAGHGVVLLGGPDERVANAWTAEHAAAELFDAGCDNGVQQFVAIVDQCDALLTGDTLAMHVAIARRTPVVALFGPTCEQEIDLFGLGRKLISPIACGPCYRRQCDKTPNCMDVIDTGQIAAAVADVCRCRQPRRVAL